MTTTKLAIDLKMGDRTMSYGVVTRINRTLEDVQISFDSNHFGVFAPEVPLTLEDGDGPPGKPIRRNA